MARTLRTLGWILAALLVVALAAFVAAAKLGERKVARFVDVRVVPVPFAKDAPSVKRGGYLFESRGCAECHAADGHGRVVVDDPGGLFVKSPNITSGPGGVVAGYGEADWVRTIRHGVNPEGHAFITMPSEDYSRMSDADLAAIVAYVRSLPPAEGSAAEIHIPLVVEALYGAGLLRDAAEKIDHRLPPAPALTPEPTAAYGAYLIHLCVGCHREDLSGGPIAGAPPAWPPASRLAGTGSAFARYDTAAKFVAMIRSGRRPDGTAVSEVMPFATLRSMNDTDLDALYAYLSSAGASPAR